MEGAPQRARGGSVWRSATTEFEFFQKVFPVSIAPENRFAFKEWAAVCAALAVGKQCLIIRKGGIHEGRDGFRVEHSEFWLYPTQFHQSPDDLTAEAQPLLDSVRQTEQGDGLLRISLYAKVEETIQITDESLLPRLAGLHILSPRVIDERFHYRTPGLFALPVRVFRLTVPIVIPESPHFAGCRSWVDFPQSLPTEGLRPVLSDGDHQTQLAAVRRSLSTMRTV